MSPIPSNGRLFGEEIPQIVVWAIILSIDKDDTGVPIILLIYVWALCTRIDADPQNVNRHAQSEQLH